MNSYGKTLLTEAKKARNEAFLIAPFIKVDALGSIIECIHNNVAITVITRWIPKEIVAGVCDLEIFDLINCRKGSSLWLHPLLHAKMFRFDENIYIGSANITGKALGWKSPSNIEILQPVVHSLQDLRNFENELLNLSIKVDVPYRDAMLKQVENTRKLIGPEVILQSEEDNRVTLYWLPTCRWPERLWSVYNQGEYSQHRMVQSAYEAASADLCFLNILPGLQEDKFKKYIAAILSQMPIVIEIEMAAKNGLTTDAGMMLIETLIADEKILPSLSVSEYWEVLQTWLVYFFPETFRTHTASTLLWHGKILG